MPYKDPNGARRYRQEYLASLKGAAVHKAGKARWEASPKGQAYKSTRKKNSRRSYLKCTYNMTEEEWDALFVNQGRCCACCGATEPKNKCGWHTDHDHQTKEVRGIICYPCNTAIGYLERPKRAVWDTYLEKFKCNAPLSLASAAASGTMSLPT